ncbi:MAG: hypothetical protein P0119_21210 [Nitrospira sp.]|nr:hypothetical protein [Nitrospira sp.]MDF0673822.1 hypothetical protein [Nitrospira sp.]
MLALVPMRLLSDPLPEMKDPIRPASLTWPLVLIVTIVIGAGSVWAVPMTDDPKGFHDIPWGTSLSSRQDLEPIQADPHIMEYLYRTEPLSFAGTEMTRILYLSVDDQFARVIIRYQGDQVHRQVLSFLENRFGRLERIPGQMARGLTQQYNWRGSDTEINLTYQAGTERGYIFIDSRSLAPRFNDYITDFAQ